MEYNDYELVYMVKEDEEALNYMIKKYEPLFRSFAYSFVKKHKYKGLDPEDIVQHLRITLCYAIDRYDSQRDVLFYSFLLTCLKRSVANFTRKQLNKPDCYNYMDLDNYDNLEEFKSSFDMYDYYIDSEYEKEIINFKNSLSTLDAQIFELRYNGFSYGDIASLLEINEKKVDNQLLKIRKKLEKYLLFS